LEDDEENRDQDEDDEDDAGTRPETIWQVKLIS
jgi:hypothetical protein